MTDSPTFPPSIHLAFGAKIVGKQEKRSVEEELEDIPFLSILPCTLFPRRMRQKGKKAGKADRAPSPFTLFWRPLLTLPRSLSLALTIQAGASRGRLECEEGEEMGRRGRRGAKNIALHRCTQVILRKTGMYCTIFTPSFCTLVDLALIQPQWTALLSSSGTLLSVYQPPASSHRPSLPFPLLPLDPAQSTSLSFSALSQALPPRYTFKRGRAEAKLPTHFSLPPSLSCAAEDFSAPNIS